MYLSHWHWFIIKCKKVGALCQLPMMNGTYFCEGQKKNWRIEALRRVSSESIVFCSSFPHTRSVLFPRYLSKAWCSESPPHSGWKYLSAKHCGSASASPDRQQGGKTTPHSASQNGPWLYLKVGKFKSKTPVRGGNSTIFFFWLHSF